jgi:hypothetical protein
MQLIKTNVLIQMLKLFTKVLRGQETLLKTLLLQKPFVVDTHLILETQRPNLATIVNFILTTTTIIIMYLVVVIITIPIIKLIKTEGMLIPTIG